MYPGAHDPAAPAIVFGERVVTFGELDRQASRVAGHLRSRGVGVGDHMAFRLENGPEFLAVAWGAHYAGAYYTAISTRLTAEETDYIVEDCGAKAYLTVDDLDDALSAAPIDEPPEERIAGKDMLYSSGTTGRPKGVKPAAPADPLDTPTSVTGLCQLLFGMTDESTYLSPAPLYHAAPLRFTMSAHQLGATSVIMDHFDAVRCLELIEAHGVTHAQFVPTMFVRMLKLPDAERAHDVSSLEVAFHAAAPCPVEVKERMIEWWGPIIHEYYAGTEGNGFVYCNSDDWLAHKGTVGRALRGEIHVCGPDGTEVPAGEEGTIWFGGGEDFEYHNDPDKTAEAHDSRGWSTLGDIGRVDEEGFLYLTDRKAYMIISGGVNIYPQEAENVLTMHPRVHDVAVIGVPDEEMGESVKAVVQPIEALDPDGPDAEALAAELIEFCRERLAHYKCPRSVDLVDELPRHPTGKLYKRLLRDRYWQAS